MNQDSPAPENKNTLIVGHHYGELDGLRAIAVFLVIYFHSSLLSDSITPSPLPDYFRFSLSWWCGVDLFFVISGFLITGILIDTAGTRDQLKRNSTFAVRSEFFLYIIFLFLQGLLPSSFLTLASVSTTGAFFTFFISRTGLSLRAKRKLFTSVISGRLQSRNNFISSGRFSFWLPTKPMSVDNFYQAIWQDREFFHRHGIIHLRSTFLYFTPCDAAGNTLIVRDQGAPVEGYQSAGVYKPAASAYDTGGIEPTTLHRLILR